LKRRSRPFGIGETPKRSLVKNGLCSLLEKAEANVAYGTHATAKVDSVGHARASACPDFSGDAVGEISDPAAHSLLKHMLRPEAGDENTGVASAPGIHVQPFSLTALEVTEERPSKTVIVVTKRSHISKPIQRGLE